MMRYSLLVKLPFTCSKLGRHYLLFTLKLPITLVLAHAFNYAAEAVKDSYPKVDLLISSVRKVLIKAYSRVNMLKEMCPEIPLTGSS